MREARPGRPIPVGKFDIAALDLIVRDILEFRRRLRAGVPGNSSHLQETLVVKANMPVCIDHDQALGHVFEGDGKKPA